MYGAPIITKIDDWIDLPRTYAKSHVNWFKLKTISRFVSIFFFNFFFFFFFFFFFSLRGKIQKFYFRENISKRKIKKSKIFRYKSKIGDDDPKAPFSITTAPRCKGECYSVPWITPLYPWSSPCNAVCYAMRYQVPYFESLVWLDLGLNPGLPDH